MKKDYNGLVNAFLILALAVCFGILSYGHFHRDNFIIGLLCLFASLYNFILFIKNILKYKRKN